MDQNLSHLILDLSNIYCPPSAIDNGINSADSEELKVIKTKLD